MTTAKKQSTPKKQAKHGKNKPDTKDAETDGRPFEAKPSLLSYDSAPDWSRDNKSITHGYRPITNSIRACYESWLYFHNETINIFSHLLPSILAVFILIALNTVFGIKYPKADYGDYLVVTFLFVTMLISLGTSATYHTLICHSQKIEAFWLKLDFVGIIVLTIGIFISAIVVGFKCHIAVQRIYCSMVCIFAFLNECSC